VADVFLTRHAMQRYRERVADVPAAEIWRALDIPAVRVAIDFGARFVRLAGGQRVVLEDNRIVTILPRDRCRGSLSRRLDRSLGDGEANGQG
jgi:hypothetical protein